MLNRKVKYFFLILILSCTKKTVYLLPEDKMVGILSDLHVAEAAVANTDPLKKDSLAQVYETQIFAIHHTNQKEFKACLKQYQKEPAKMEQVYKKVTEKLNQRFH